MFTKLFLCARCQNNFKTEVLEPGEAEAKRLMPVPLSCPKCGSTALIDPQKV